MRSNFVQLSRQLTHIGLEHQLDKLRKIQLINFNILLVVACFILFLSLSSNIITLSWTMYDTIIYAGGFSLIFCFLLLNKFGLFSLSSFVAHIAFNILFCLGAIAKGAVFECCIMNMVLMVMSFHFLESTKQTKVLAFIQLVFVNVTIFLTMYIEYAHEIVRFNPIERCIAYSLMFIFLFVISNGLSIRNKKNYTKINELVSELRTKNKKIEIKNEKIKRAYDEMESFSYVVSHDLKTPLRNMNNYASLLKREVRAENLNNVIDYSDVICSNGMKLTEMIDEILNYSKLNANGSGKFDSIKLSEIIDPIKNFMVQIYPNSEIILETDGLICASKIKLKMLFQNLIENGLKYNQSQIKKVSIDYVKENSQSTILVKDNGIGIKQKYCDQIFKIFTRLHSDKEFDGTGIGLATCKKIVEQHLHGRISVESNPNNGSVFKLVIPIMERA